MEVETTSRKLRLDFFNQGSDVFQPASKKTRLSKHSGAATNAQITRQHPFTMADLQKCLYCPRTPKTVPVTKPQDTAQDKQDTVCFWCDASITEPNFKCPLHKHGKSTGQQAAELPLAVRSFPPEVGFCVSNIPGAGLGVCAKRVIPVGAWIGPYEGTFVRPEDLCSFSDTSYMWEIYKDGKLSGFIDGNNEMTSCWMRYIRCARHKQEQNLFAFQYLGKVYYRSFKPILPGQEMLVWYDEKYPQYLGIPSAIFDLGQIGTTHQPSSVGVVENLVLNNAPPTPPSSVPSPSSPATPNPVGQPINSEHFSPIGPISSEPLNGAQPEMTSEFELPSGFCRTEKPNPGTVTPVEEEASNQSPPLPLLVADNTPTHREGEGASSVKSSEAVLTQVAESSVWRCGQCKKSFPQRTMLQIHICDQTPKKPYQCGHCSESFSRTTELRAHAVIHASKKPFKCGFCSRTFAGSTTLNNHIRTHTGEKPFVCEACGKNFTQGSQLSRHHRIPGDCVARA